MSFSYLLFLKFFKIFKGAPKEKRKWGRRLHERKFIFDWEPTDDTSNDYNDLYKERHEVQFLGRGSIAGMDVNQQKKQKSEFYQKLLEQRRSEAEKEQEKHRFVIFFWVFKRVYEYY